jgi:foldase protein PrsA
MARKRKTSARRLQRTEETVDFSPETSTPEEVQKKPKLFSKKNITFFVILVLIIVVWQFKGMFIAATVNGSPISRFQVDDQLRKRFGSQVLDNIINERLIMGATRQKGIFVTEAEITAKISEIEKRLQGQTTIDEALKAQGMTKDDLHQQIEIQIAIDKMFTAESTISAKEIDDYITQNKELTKNATDPAALKEEVTNILKQQKTADSFDKWFAQLKQNAKVNKFL